MQANGSSLSAPGLQQSSVAQAKAQEEVALAQAQQIRVSISKATIISPIDGVVVNRNLNPGEYPGLAGNLHPAASLADLRDLAWLVRPGRGHFPGATATVTD